MPPAPKTGPRYPYVDSLVQGLAVGGSAGVPLERS